MTPHGLSSSLLSSRGTRNVNTKEVAMDQLIMNFAFLNYFVVTWEGIYEDGDY